jgi:hypothetical protein
VVLLALMALLIWLPIPFGNVLPAFALVMLGLGLAFRDGLAVLAGFLVGGVALAGTTAAGLAAWQLGAAGFLSLLQG